MTGGIGHKKKKVRSLTHLLLQLSFGRDSFAPVPSYQFQQLVHCLLGGDVLLDALLASVEAHPSASGTDVAVVSVRHLARTVDDAAHDANLQSFQVGGGSLDACQRVLQVEEGASAARTGDVFGLARPHAGSLEDAEGGSVDHGRRQRPLVVEEDAVAQSVKEQGAQVGCRLDLKVSASRSS